MWFIGIKCYDEMVFVFVQIETPNAAGKTLYDEWLKTFPKTDPEGNKMNVPKFVLLPTFYPLTCVVAERSRFGSG